MQQKKYGRFVNLAGHTERSSEDNKEHNRPDPNAQEEKRMNFVRIFAYKFQNNPYICSAYHLLIKTLDAGRRLALTLQAFFMSAYFVEPIKILVSVYPRVCA